MTDSTPAHSPSLPRRALLGAAGLGALGLGASVLAGCASGPVLAQGSAPTTPTATPGQIIYGSLNSTATGQTHPWVICYPPGTKPGAHLPVAIMLHGLGDDLSAIERIGYPQALAATVQTGGQPFAIAAIYGGTLFWQKMGTQDAGALVSADFLALLKKQGLNTARLALGGWSMGGWGSLRLACDELHRRLRAVAVLSTPCFARYDQVHAETWMTQQQFDSNNFYNRPQRLAGLPIFMGCGESDGFYPGNVAFVGVLSTTPGVVAPVTDFGPGDHSQNYWRGAAWAQVNFLGQHLSA